MYQGHWDQKYGHISYSQRGEDIFIVGLFDRLGIDEPSYLDLGAHHPVEISNTALLYSRGSKGVNVEANPRLIGDFLRYRPEDINVCCGVGPERGTFDFYMSDDHGITNSFIRSVTEKNNAITEIIKVEVLTLDDIVSKYCGGKFPQFLNCDIEGFDFETFCSYSFTQGRPSIICIESDHNIGLGYRRIVRIGANSIYCLEELWERM